MKLLKIISLIACMALFCSHSYARQCHGVCNKGDETWCTHDGYKCHCGKCLSSWKAGSCSYAWDKTHHKCKH